MIHGPEEVEQSEAQVRYEIARLTTDAKKLFRLMPTWLKTRMKTRGLSTTDPHRGYHFPTHYADMTTAEYVENFVSRNNLVKA